MNIPSFISKDITVGQVLSISRFGCNKTNQPSEMIQRSSAQVMDNHANSIQDVLGDSLEGPEMIISIDMSFEDSCEKLVNKAVQSWAHGVVNSIKDHSINIKMVDVHIG